MKQRIEVAYPKAARAIQEYLGIEEKRLTIPNITLGIRSISEQAQQERKRAERAEELEQAAMEKGDSYANRYAQAAKERDELRRELQNILDANDRFKCKEIARRALGQ